MRRSRQHHKNEGPIALKIAQSPALRTGRNRRKIPPRLPDTRSQPPTPKQAGARPLETIPDNFLGLPPRYCDPKKARYAILPLPYDGTVSYQTGTRNGPRAIITASQQVELFDEEYGKEFTAAGVMTCDPVAPEMAGPREMHESVYQAARQVLAKKKFLIALGGEHSLTSGLVRAVKRKHKKLSVLQIDAHADLRAEYEGTPYSHAAVMRRVVEMGIPVVAVGIRNYSLGEHQFMKKHGITPVSVREVRTNADWLQQVVEQLTDNVYVTIDIDGFDPAYAPGTGTPEPGGLDWFQVNDLLKATAMFRNIVAADVVEVLPQPGTAQTEFLAAKLVYKLIAHVDANRRRA
ncbi:MAG: agmatinase [Planctomycetes bacterium UTPLA1]|nr:MAG: agmatinase [Planctomycetes bacterium UTPLA1]